MTAVRPKRVLISGGGVAGLTLAYWLERYGHTPVVVERAPGPRGGGYGFDFSGTGYDVADRMGIIDRLTPHQLPVDSVTWVNGAGSPVARLGTDLLERAIQGPYLGLMHDTLTEAIADAVGDRVEIRYGQMIRGVRQQPGGIDVTLEGETEPERFDLLAGADGVHSLTRSLVFGPEERFAHYLGCYLACYPMPESDELAASRSRTHYSEPGRQTVVYPTGRPGEAIALLLFKAPNEGAIARDDRLPRLRAAFAGSGWITPDLLSAAPKSGGIFMDTMTQISMPSWQHERVALIGDAAGCATLVSGQGVAMAMGGAYVLASALRDLDDHRAAFRRYEQRMHGEVERRQRTARTFARSLIPSSRTGVAIQHAVSRLLLRDRFAGLLGRRFAASSILTQADFSEGR